MADQRARSSWPFYAAVGLILLALPIGYLVLLGSEPPAPAPVVAPAPAPPEKKPLQIQLRDVQGTVEIRRGDGDWTAAKGGELMSRSDGVRTGERSSAVLLGGDVYQVKMESNTEVAIADLSDSISRLLLEGGMATAQVNGEARHQFEVRAAGSDAVARTQSGTFSISNNRAGTVAVGTHQGEVEFLGSGKVVIVRAGQQSIVRPGQGPSDPVPIPSSLLLKVNLPGHLTVNRRKVVLAGRAEPGAVVEIGGRAAPVGADGTFKQTLEFPDGKHELEVRARSVGKLEAESRHRLEVDTRVNQFSIESPTWGSPSPER